MCSGNLRASTKDVIHFEATFVASAFFSLSNVESLALMWKSLFNLFKGKTKISSQPLESQTEYQWWKTKTNGTTTKVRLTIKAAQVRDASMLNVILQKIFEKSSQKLFHQNIEISVKLVIKTISTVNFVSFVNKFMVIMILMTMIGWAVINATDG